MDVNQRPIEMTSDELFARTALNSWKQVVSRFSTAIEPLTGEQLQKQVAPGKNRLLYLVGHLTAIHDRMFPLLGIGERLHPELDAVYIDNPDRSVPDPLSPGSDQGSMDRGKRPAHRCIRKVHARAVARKAHCGVQGRL